MSSLTELILSHVIELAIAVTTPVILLLVRKLVLVIEQKLHVDLAQHQEDYINKLVLQGISYAEEQAHKALKSNGAAPSPEDKKAMAVEYVYDQMKKHNLATTAGALLSKK